MATLKAKTIAFILSAVQTNPRAIALAEFVGLVIEIPPQGKKHWIRVEKNPTNDQQSTEN